MVSVILDGVRWKRNRYPILASAVVGLVTGVLGIFATTNLQGSPIGGFVGAISGGVTAIALSEGGTEALGNALIADVVSSIAFFSSPWAGQSIGTQSWSVEGGQGLAESDRRTQPFSNSGRIPPQSLPQPAGLHEPRVRIDLVSLWVVIDELYLG